MISRRLAASRKGVSLTSYALLVGLISIVALIAVQDIGDSTKSLFGDVSESLSGVTATPATPTPRPVGPPVLGSGSVILPTNVVFEDVTAQTIALFDDPDQPLLLTLAANVDGACVTASRFGSNVAELSSASSPCTGSFQVIIQDSLGEVASFVTVPVTVTDGPYGTGPCPSSPPQAGEEGCDPGDGTIFVGFIDSNGEETGGENTRIFMPPFDLNASGDVGDGADRALISWKDSNTADTIEPTCSNILLSHTDMRRGCFDGAFNTVNQVADSTGVHPAAEACDALGYMGGNWYLPAINELMLMHTNLRSQPGDSDGNGDDLSDLFNYDLSNSGFNSLYWSSSANGINVGNFWRMSGASGGTTSRTAGMRIRCVRRG